MHDSFTPLGGLIPLLNIQLGEVVFGGVGAGLYGMLVYVVIAVFIAGLMVGRTPEFLGKKIEPYDVKMASFVILILAFSLLGFSAWASAMGTCRRRRHFERRDEQQRPAWICRDPLRLQFTAP
jgi:K+-transporting ATPase ATPase A chain